MTNSYFFTSESVSEGHPDKVSDQISDAVLDALLSQDPNSRVAAETLCNTGLVVLAGEISSNSDVDYIQVARDTLKKIGYNNTEFGIDYKWCAVLVAYDKQISDIAMGVNRKKEDLLSQGAGDQGLMFGYACDETENLMPVAIDTAHRIVERQSILRHKGTLPWLRPDAKSQVSLQYEGGKVKRADQIVVSTQHTEGSEQLLKSTVGEAVNNVMGDLIDKDTIWHINPTGKFVIGGPDGDTGLTGRKIIVDTYGGFAPHGGGAFSGKDPTKVDRSAAYMARWLAKNVVADEMADWCQIQLSYAIGVKEPTSIYVDSNGHNRSIQKFIENNIDLTPKGIIDRFDLFNFYKYSENCVYGHFGDKNVPWEQIGWERKFADADEWEKEINEGC